MSVSDQLFTIYPNHTQSQSKIGGMKYEAEREKDRGRERERERNTLRFLRLLKTDLHEPMEAEWGRGAQNRWKPNDSP